MLRNSHKSLGIEKNIARDLREGDHFEDEGVDGRIILKWIIIEKWDRRGLDWIDLYQDRNRWWALVNAVMNLRVP